MCEPMWPFLLMYGSHNMRHTGFRRLMVVNGTPGFGASQIFNVFKTGPDRSIRLVRSTAFSIQFSHQTGLSIESGLNRLNHWIG